MIDEPMTMLTDYVLATVAAWLGFLLFRAREGQTSRKYWALAFATLALGSALGGTYHGFASRLDDSTHHLLWKATVLTIGVASFGMTVGSAVAVTADLPRKLAAVMAVSQRPASLVTLGEPSGPPAWAGIPSYALIPTKDNTIGGNLIIQGWTGMWIGLIRNDVGGNVDFSKNTAMDTSVVPGSDSSEVQTNVIAGNLICHGNTPTAQVNQFDGGEPNEIGGNAVGECPPRIVDNPTE